MIISSDCSLNKFESWLAHVFTLSDNPKRTYPFIADGNKIYKLAPRLHGHSTFGAWTPGVPLKRIGGLAYDPIQGELEEYLLIFL